MSVGPILISGAIILLVAFIVAMIMAILTPSPHTETKDENSQTGYLDRDPRTGQWRYQSHDTRSQMSSYSSLEKKPEKVDPDLALKAITKAVADYSGRTKAEFSEPLVLILRDIDKMARALKATEETPLAAAVVQFELSIARILKDYAKINPLSVQTQLPVRRVVDAVKETMSQYATYRSVSVDTGHTKELMDVVSKVTNAVSEATLDIDKIEHARVQGEMTKLDIELQVLRSSTKS